MTAMLEIEGLVAGYDGVSVVHGIDLRVEEGEVVALLGPNGAGKTTTLLTISGLLRPIKGSVRVLGEPANGLACHLIARRGVAHVPEDRALFSQLTVAENLRLGRKRGGPPVSTLFEYFPALEPLMRRQAGLLSGGEQQMLAVGRALLSEPRLLLVDEMSLGLAPVIVQRMLPILPRIARESGAAVLFVEQHVHLALEHADRGYVLNRGEVSLAGSSAELRERRDLVELSYIGGAALEDAATAPKETSA
jgi:branched-chain amino acid transport system ATP-binding protein